MKQVYFTINADYGNDGAFSLLSDDVTEFDIKRAISKDEIPVYVSSVCYGCLIVISIQTSQSFNELENELNVDSGFSFNAKSSNFDFIEELNVDSGNVDSGLRNDPSGISPMIKGMVKNQKKNYLAGFLNINIMIAVIII